MNYSDDFHKMIKKYNDELRKMQARAVFNPNENEARVDLTQSDVKSKDDLTQEDVKNKTNLAQSDIKSDADFTQGDIKSNNNLTAEPFPFTNDYDLPNINQDEMIDGQYENLTGLGKLVVKVFTANQAVPVNNASVLVSIKKPDGEHLISSLKTNADGDSPVIELPTVAIEQSLKPEIKNPYATYQVKVAAPNFFTIDSINVPIFDKQTALQPIEMLPIPNGFEGDQILHSNDTGPIDL